ncbi:MAG: PAS domain S-box protein [Acetobacteraceae bacterium]
MNDIDMIPRQRADRHQLQQIIAGLTDGVILVDPDQSIVWANEAALAMHGIESREELGATAGEYRQRFVLQYRNNHRLDAADYPIDRLIAGKAFSDVVVEVAPAGEEECHWTHRVRGLVLTDSAGEPDCLVLVLHDATERFNAEQRFEQAFGANPAPAIICRLRDLRYVKVNQGFLEMTGYGRADVIGRSVYEIDVLANAADRGLAVERLNEGRTIPQLETELPLPGGAGKCVIVAGQPIDVGDDACMLFTFMDLEPRKAAEAALRQSEERFSKSFRLTPLPIAISALADFKILDVNDAFVAVTGYAVEDIAGRRAAEVGLWASPALRRQFEQELGKGRSVRNFEMPLRTKDGGTIECLVSAETTTIQGRPCVLSAIQDITDRKRSEAELIAAIEAVMRDGSWFSRTVIEKLAELRQPPGTNRRRVALKGLTVREREVLALTCQGLAYPDIARHLRLSRNTIRNLVASLYRKTDVHHRSALVVWARERGITGDQPGQTSRLAAMADQAANAGSRRARPD